MSSELEKLQQRIVACELCPRLRCHCEQVAKLKRRAYRHWHYWGKPLPGFGDGNARLLLVGLAPAAHGGNRTGRIFTGDRSGSFLMRSMHRAGFANQPDSVHREDGLRLRDAYISAVVRCAPPDNKPTPKEIARCLGYLEKELELLPHLRAVLCLGRIAHDGFLSVLQRQGPLRRSAFPFAHGRQHQLPWLNVCLFDCYHPSQQNTQTGKLTQEMMDAVFLQIGRFLRGKAKTIEPVTLGRRSSAGNLQSL